MGFLQNWIGSIYIQPEADHGRDPGPQRQRPGERDTLKVPGRIDAAIEYRRVVWSGVDVQRIVQDVAGALVEQDLEPAGTDRGAVRPVLRRRQDGTAEACIVSVSSHILGMTQYPRWWDGPFARAGPTTGDCPTSGHHATTPSDHEVDGGRDTAIETTPMPHRPVASATRLWSVRSGWRLGESVQGCPAGQVPARAVHQRLEAVLGHHLTVARAGRP